MAPPGRLHTAPGLVREVGPYGAGPALGSFADLSGYHEVARAGLAVVYRRNTTASRSVEIHGQRTRHGPALCNQRGTAK